MTTMPTLVFEVNWNGDGSTWVDESANVDKITCRRGRDYASALSGRVQAGELTARLQNVAQRYSDFNVASPLYGNIIPGRKVRWRETVLQNRVLWQGFLSDPTPDPGDRKTAAYATLRCSGPLWWTAEHESSTAISSNIFSGAALGIVLDDAGWPAGDRTIDTGQLQVIHWKADTVRQDDTGRLDPRKALLHMQEIEESEMGLLSESADGKIVFEDAHHRLLSPHTVSQATFSDASGAALPFDTINELSAWRLIYNRFTAEVIPYTVGGGATLWSLSGEVPAIGPLSSYKVTAIYPDPSAPAQAVDVSSWGTPTLLANAAPDGTGIDMTASISIATVKKANTMDITLTNNDSSRTAYITSLQATGNPGNRGDTGRVESTDAVSISKYGKRTYPLGGRFYPTLARAQQFCDWGLSRYKDPQPLLDLTFRAQDSDAAVTQFLLRDISDRITVVANGTTSAGAQLGISADFFIETIQYEHTLKGTTVTLRLSYAGGPTLSGDSYWNLGVATLGATTKLVI